MAVCSPLLPLHVASGWAEGVGRRRRLTTPMEREGLAGEAAHSRREGPCYSQYPPPLPPDSSHAFDH